MLMHAFSFSLLSLFPVITSAIAALRSPGSGPVQFLCLSQLWDYSFPAIPLQLPLSLLNFVGNYLFKMGIHWEQGAEQPLIVWLGIWNYAPVPELWQLVDRKFSSFSLGCCQWQIPVVPAHSLISTFPLSVPGDNVRPLSNQLGPQFVALRKNFCPSLGQVLNGSVFTAISFHLGIRFVTRPASFIMFRFVIYTSGNKQVNNVVQLNSDAGLP